MTDGKNVEHHLGVREFYLADRLGALVFFREQVRPYLVFGHYFVSDRRNTKMKKVVIVMGSDSDMPIAEKAVAVLKEFEVPFEVHVYSAHRTPMQAAELAENARKNGVGAIIGIAGMAAHLAGALAAKTTVPVIGIPCKSAGLGGLDALLSTVQMPSGIPVATVAIDGGANAALLAVQILAVGDDALAVKLDAKRAADAKKVLDKNAAAEVRFM